MRFSSIASVALAILIAGAQSLPAATVNWVTAGDGQWTTASNWSTSALPGANDDVVIDTLGLATVTLQFNSQSIRSLVVADTLSVAAPLSLAADSSVSGTMNLNSTLTGPGNLSVTGRFFWNSGTMSGTGKLTIGPTALGQIFAASSVTLSRVVDNAGLFLMSPPSTQPATMSFSNGTFNNLATGTFNYSDSGTTTATIFFGGGNDAFNNAGTFNYTAAASRSSSVVFNNSGTLNVNAGTFTFARGGTNTGVINTFPGANLGTGGAIVFTNAGTINLRATTNATLAFQAPGFVNTVDGRINILSGAPSITGSTSTNLGEINIGAPATLTLDSFTHAASSKITGAGSLILRNNTFAGLIKTTGSVDIIAGVTFTSDQEIAGEFSMGASQSSSPVVTKNANIKLQKSLNWVRGNLTGAGTVSLLPNSVSTINLQAAAQLGGILENAGTINHSVAGTALSLQSATINNLAGAVYNITPTTSNGFSAFSGGGSTFNNAGTLNINKSLSSPNNSFTLGVPVNNSGVMNIEAPSSFTATVANTGVLNLFSVAGPGSQISLTLTNSGVANFDVASLILNTASTNAASGKLNVLRGSMSFNAGTNSGEINIAPNASVTIAGQLQPAGSPINGAGTLNLGSLGSYSGTLGITGTLNLTGSTNFNTNQTVPGTVNFTGGMLGGTADFTVSGQFNWTGGAMAPSGKTIIAPTGVANVTTSTAVSLSRILENAGTLNIAGTANFPFSNSAALTNLASGTVNIRTGTVSFTATAAQSIVNAGAWNVELTSTTAVLTENLPFTNSGTVNVTVGSFILGTPSSNSGTINVYPSGTLTVHTFTNTGTINFVNGNRTLSALSGSSPFSNTATGQINILSGSLAWAPSGLQNAGKINVSAGASFSAGVNSLAGSSINGPGSISLSGTIAGELKSTGPISLGDVTFNADQTLAGPVNVFNGISGSGNVVAENNFVWQPQFTSSTLGGTGKLTLKGASIFKTVSSTMTISKVIENSGHLNWTFEGGLTFNNGTINNLSTGTINAVLPAIGGNGTPGLFGTNAFNNAGTFNKIGSPTLQFRTALPFNNSGLVNVQNGFFIIDTGTHSGTFNIAQTARLWFREQMPVFNTGTNFTGTGELVLDNGGVLPSPSTFSGVTTVTAGTLTLGHSLALQNSTLDLTSGNLSFGTLTSATLGNLRGAKPISLTNEDSAAVALTVGTNNLSNFFLAPISGAGSLTKVGAGDFNIAAGSQYIGTTTVAGGALFVHGHIGGGDYTVKSGAKLGADQTIASAVTVENGGILAPNNTAASLTVGSLKLNPTSFLDIELGGTTVGTQYDRLTSLGSTTLDGTLRVALTNNFAPAENDVFDILDAPSFTGMFAKLELPPLVGPFVWDTTQLYVTGELSIDETFLAGDLNRDGKASPDDILAMLKALNDIPAYQASRGLSEQELLALADFNHSGSVSNADLQPLLNLIAAQSTGDGQVASVPEPTSILSALAAIATAMLARRRIPPIRTRKV